MEYKRFYNKRGYPQELPFLYPTYLLYILPTYQILSSNCFKTNKSYVAHSILSSQRYHGKYES